MRRLAVYALVFFVGLGVIVGGAILASQLLTRTPLTERCIATAGDFSAQIGFEQAEYASLISGTSVRRGLPPRAATIALATAYQESDIRNIDYGDRDSLGLFQQRPSMGWGTPDQIMDPYYSTEKFYDHLEKVKGYEQLPIAEAAQAVQRSAFGEAYARHEPSARALASTLTGQSPRGFSCTLVSDLPKGSVETVRQDLRRTFGLTDEGDEAALRVEVDRRALGWAVAHWAVANAKRLGIASVTYAGYEWRSESSDAGWEPVDRTDTDAAVLTLAV